MGRIRKGAEAMKKITVFFILYYLFFAGVIYAYDDERTHRQLTQRSLDAANLSSYLRSQIKFNDGTSSMVGGRTIGWWLREGSYLEDNPTCRACNHFHNPLKPWDQAFMTDDSTFIGGLVRQHCNLQGWLYSDRKSNLTWGTGFQSPNGSPINRLRQEMGWDHARQYYYSALTALSLVEKENYFVKTFQALGQVLHLLQDLAVPAHVRNDFTSHLVFQGFESINPVTWLSNSYEYYVKNNAALVNVSTAALPGFSNPKVTDFWDTDLYSGSIKLADLAVGLAEHTNARYFSDSTIPNSGVQPEHFFLFPSLDSINYQICEDYSEDLTEIKKYVSRRDKGACPPLSAERTADHFALVSILENPAITEANLFSLRLLLDQNVHHTYAEELIPRAIGYSAALLDHFFRGRIQVTAVPIFYRGSLQFMRLKIKNLAEETMSQGEFLLTYRYTPSGGNADGTDDIVKPAWPVNSSSALVPCIELRNQQEMVVDFRMDSPLPRSEFGSLKFTLAFKGTLGNEPGAVIGKTFNTGWVVFEEEWDKSFTGNYLWAHTGVNWNSLNPDNGSSTNEVAEDILTKKNIRSAGTRLGRVNESFLGDKGFVLPLPIAITPNTYLMYKIDDMSMSPLNTTNGVIGHQFLFLSFTNLLTLMISQEGQMEEWNPTTAYYTFSPGLIILDNIYESFDRAEIVIPTPMQLNFLSLAQRWYELQSAAPTDQVQTMKVDFIQIIEANVE